MFGPVPKSIEGEINHSNLFVDHMFILAEPLVPLFKKPSDVQFEEVVEVNTVLDVNLPAASSQHPGTYVEKSSKYAGVNGAHGVVNEFVEDHALVSVGPQIALTLQSYVDSGINEEMVVKVSVFTIMKLLAPNTVLAVSHSTCH